MKKAIVIFSCWLLGMLPGRSTAQNWSATLMVDPYPSPYLSSWETDPTLGSLELVNNTTEPDVVIVYLDIASMDGAVGFQGNSRRILVNPGVPEVMRSTEFQDWSTGSIDESIKQQITQTGMIPEGTYEVTVEVRNLWGITLVDNLSAFFTIDHPEPPELIYPVNEEVVYSPYPVFQWIPPQLPAGKETVYTIRIVEILSGQTPDMALNANFPHYENFNVFEADFEYPIDGLPLQADRQYAWQVMAIDYSGLPTTKNNGRSEIGVFRTDPDLAGELPELILVAPGNEALSASPLPDFEWLEPAVVVDGLIYYTLEITPVNTYQTPEDAMRLNTPLFINTGTITETQFRYPAAEPPLVPGQRYAWQVTARDHYGYPAAADDGKSEIRTFTVTESEIPDNLVDLLPDRLPLPRQDLAYLQLRDGKTCHVTCAMSSDSTQLLIHSKSAGSVPIHLPALSGDGSDISTGAVVDLTLDRFTMDILDGTVTASSSAAWNSPFHLSGPGLPLAVRSIRFSTQSGGQLRFEAAVAAFGSVSGNTPVELTVTADGFFYGMVHSGTLDLDLPLAPGHPCRLLWTGVGGTIGSGTSLDNLDFEIGLDGNLLFENAAAPAVLPVSLVMTRNGMALTHGGGSVALQKGAASLNLALTSIDKLVYQESASSLDFDLVFDLTISFPGFTPSLSLPALPGIHLTPGGLHIPSTDGLLSGHQMALKRLRISPDAFHIADTRLDLTDSGAEPDIRFDIAVELTALPPRLSPLAAVPLTVLNAMVTENGFQGSVEPRSFLSPLRAPLVSGLPWGFDIHEIQGTLNTGSTLPLVLQLSADFIPPQPLLDQGVTPFSLADGALTLDTDGIFTARHDNAFSSIVLPWEMLSVTCTSGHLIVSRSATGQAAGFQFDGTVDIPSLPPDQPAKANGSGFYDLIAAGVSSGSFTTSQPFTIGLPWSAPVMKCRCTSGAAADPDGIHLTDGPGQLLLDDGHTMDISYTGNVLLSHADMMPAAGVIELSGPFDLRVRQLRGSGAGMEWLAMGPGSALSSDSEELLLGLPASVRIENGLLVHSGQNTAGLRYANLDFTGLEARFSSDFRFGFKGPGITQGRIEFFSENTPVATIDSRGFWPGDIFTQSDLQAPMRLPLPDESIAYIQLMDSSGTWLLDHQESGLDIFLNTSAELVLPGLQYGRSAPPTVTVSLENVTVNRANMQVTGGTIGTGSSASAIDMKDAGLPLEITRLTYDNASQILRAGIHLSLPAVFDQPALNIPDVAVRANGLSEPAMGDDSGPLLSAAVGAVMTVTVDRIDGSRINTDGLVRLTGQILMNVFREDNVAKPLDYTLSLTPGSAAFSVQPAFSDASGYALPMGKAQLRMTDESGNIRMNVQAPFNDSNLIVTFEALTLSMPDFGDGLRLILNNLIVDKNGIQPPSIPTDPPQSLSLCGLDFFLEGSQNVSWINTPPGLELNLSGTLRLLSQDVPFSNLAVITDGSVSGQNILTGSVSTLNNLIRLTAIQPGGQYLSINGTITPLTPFETAGAQPFTLKVDPNGNWLDDDGGRLAERRITALEGESPDGQDVLLGSLPLQVRCRPSGLSVLLTSSLTEATGELDVLINTYWPKFDLTDPANNKEMILLTGNISFDKGTLGQETWTLEDKTVPAFVLAELIKLEVENLTASTQNGFKIMLGGNLTLSCLPEGSGGCQFEDFALTPETTVFGTISDGELNFYGLNLAVSDFSYGTDVQSFEFSSGDLSSGTFETGTRSIGGGDSNFYVTFGATISTEMEGFSGGVDRLLIYKGSSKFYMLIENANFEVQDAVKGRLDMEALIPLTLENFEFQLSMGGSLTIQETGFAAVGEIAFREDRVFGQDVKMPSFGLFFGLIGTDIVLVPLPVSLTDIGGGIFFNPTDKIEGWVTANCGLDNESQWLKDSFGAYKQTNPLLSVFFLAGLAIPTKDGVIRGRVLYSMASDHIRMDNEVSIFSSGAMSSFLDISAKGHLAAGFQNLISEGSVTDFYIEGCLEATITLKKLCDIAPTLDFAFGVVKNGSEFHWGIQGNMSVDILSILTADYDLFVGDPGFLIEGELTAGFDISILSVDAGLKNAIWIVWDPNNPSMGAYMTGYIAAEVFWGAAWARGELGAALMLLPDVYMYGYAELDCGFLGWSWNESAWARWQDGSFDGGLGENEGMAVILAEAEAAANAIKGQAQEIQGDLASSSIPIRLGIDAAMMNRIVTNMSAGRADLYDALEQDRKFVVEILNALRFGDYTDDFNAYVATIRNGLDPSYISGLRALKNSAVDYQSDFQTALSNNTGSLTSRFQDAQNSLGSLDYEVTGSMSGGDSLNLLENPLNASDGAGSGTIQTFSVNESKVNANQTNCTAYSSSIGTSLAAISREIVRLDSIRSIIYQTMGPGSAISATQSAFVGAVQGAPDEASLFDDMNGYFDTYAGMKTQINAHVYSPDDPLAVLLRSLQNMISFENAQVNYYEEAFKNSVDLRKNTIDALADTLRDLDAFDLNIQEMRVAAELTARQFYGDIPMAFAGYTQKQLDSLFIRITNVYKNYLMDKNTLHRELTVKTDELWDRYAELSEKLYMACQQYIVLARSNESGDSAPDLSVMEERMRRLEQELYLPSPSSIQVTRTLPPDRYGRADISVSLGGASADLSEYAFQWMLNGYQATGTASSFSQPMYPRAIGATENYTLKGRYRNKSGLTVESAPVNFSIAYTGASVGTTTFGPPVASSPPAWPSQWPPTTLTILGAKRESWGNMSLSGTQYHCTVLESGSGVKIAWPRASSPGSGGIAQYEVCVEAWDHSLVKDWTAAAGQDSTHILFDMQQMIPYFIKVRARDLAGLYSAPITTKNGWPVVYNPNPSRFPENAEPVIRYTTDELSVSLPLAGEYLFETPDEGICRKLISTGYEFQIITDGSSPDAGAWKAVSAYTDDIIISTYFGTIKFLSHPDSTAMLPQSLLFEQPFHIALRVKKTGSGDIVVSPRVFRVGRLDDPLGPWSLDAVFNGWNLGEDIQILINRAGRDDETGIAGIQYAVGRSESSPDIRPFPVQTGDAPVYDFGPESNKPGAILSCPVNMSSVELAGDDFVVVLRVFNGQNLFTDYVIQDRVFGASYTPDFQTDYNAAGVPVLSMVFQPVQYFHFYLFETGSTDPVMTETKTNTSSSVTFTLPENLESGRTYRAAFRMRSYTGYHTPVYFVPFSLPLHWPPFQAEIRYDGRFHQLHVQGQLDERALSEGVQTLQLSLGTWWNRGDVLPETAFRMNETYERSVILPDDIQPGQFVYLTAQVRNAENMFSSPKNMRFKIPFPDLFTSTDFYLTREAPEYHLQFYGALNPEAMKADISTLLFLLGSRQDDNDIAGGTPYAIKLAPGQTSVDFLFRLAEDRINAGQTLYLSVIANPQNGAASDTFHVETTVPEIPPPRLNLNILRHPDSGDMLVCSTAENAWTSAARIEFRAGSDRGLDDIAADRSLSAALPESRIPLDGSRRGSVITVTARSVADDGGQSPVAYFKITYSTLDAPRLTGAVMRTGDGYLLRLSGEGDAPDPAVSFLEVWAGTEPGRDDVLPVSKHWSAGDRSQFDFLFSGDLWTGETPLHITARYGTASGELSPEVQFTASRTDWEPLIESITETSMKPELHIRSEGFNGELDVAGYRYALGSRTGFYDIRPFPYSLSTFDFGSDAVRAGGTVTLPDLTTGMPAQVWVALQAVSAQGLTQKTEILFEPRPRAPSVTAWFYMRQNSQYFVVEIDPASVRDAGTALVSVTIRYEGRNYIVWTDIPFDGYLSQSGFRREVAVPYAVGPDADIQASVYYIVPDGNGYYKQSYIAAPAVSFR